MDGVPSGGRARRGCTTRVHRPGAPPAAGSPGQRSPGLPPVPPRTRCTRHRVRQDPLLVPRRGPFWVCTLGGTRSESRTGPGLSPRRGSDPGQGLTTRRRETRLRRAHLSSARGAPVSLLPIPTHDYGTNRPETAAAVSATDSRRRARDRGNGHPQVIPASHRAPHRSGSCPDAPAGAPDLMARSADRPQNASTATANSAAGMLTTGAAAAHTGTPHPQPHLASTNA